MTSGKTDVELFSELCLAMPDTIQVPWDGGRGQALGRGFRLTRGEQRMFALWVEQGGQPGAHLRYADAGRLQQAGVERCRAHAGTKHNWMYLQPDAVDAATLRALVAESYQAAQERGGGKAVSAREVYAPLRRGLALASPALHPQELHAAGPAAKITGREGIAAFRLALFSVEAIAALVPPSEGQALADALHDLRAALQLHERLTRELPPEKVRMGEGYRQLSAAATELKDPCGDSPPVVAARAACAAFRCLPGGYDTRAVSAAGDAVEAAVRALSGASLRQYLVEIDDRALLFELEAVAASKAKTTPPIARVLWRGVDDKGFPALWLARLDGETPRYGLLAKIGRRWTWSEGSRDDMLSSVPDAQFEAAVRCTAIRDR